MDLIDDNDVVIRCQFFSKALWALTEAKVDRGVQEIIDPSPFQAMADQEALAGLARPREEMRFVSQKVLEVKQTGDDWDELMAVSLAGVASVVTWHAT